MISTEHLFHYFLSGDQDSRKPVLEEGLRPLSDFPESQRWHLIERHEPGFFRKIHRLWAAPVLADEYTNSGIFLTPIDFRAGGPKWMHERPRLRIPLNRVDPAKSVLTYKQLGQRRSFLLSEDALVKAAQLWSPAEIEAWLGKDPEKLFYFVPQVVTYQGRVLVRPEDLE